MKIPAWLVLLGIAAGIYGAWKVWQASQAAAGTAGSPSGNNAGTSTPYAPPNVGPAGAKLFYEY